ncbi:MAG: ROK family protein [Acidilobaceae archaeon]|nr:ROK family protein [Acidilobaceae archaeon]
MRVLAVDVGGTKVRAALFEGTEMLYRKEVPTPRAGGPYAVAEAIERLADGSFEVISVASMGPLDMESGWVIAAPNSPIGKFAIREPLERAFGVPVLLYNDCVAAAWGEHVLGRGKGMRDLVYVTISTGIGVGAVVDGELAVGRRGNAHEGGHIVVDLHSDLQCGCGGYGHWEALGGGANLWRVAQRKAREWGESSEGAGLALAGEMSPELLYSLARRGDPFALRLVDYLNSVHAAGIASLIAVYDPEAIFVGGSIFLNNEDLMKEKIEEYARKYSILGVPPIYRATFGPDAVLYGALAIALRPPQRA